MAVLSSTVARTRRLRRLFREVRQETGSVLSASRYTGRVVAAKLPLLLRQTRQFSKRGTVARRIESARESLGGSVPLLGIKVTGGLGDFLVIARFLRDVRRYAGDFEFDIYSTDPDRARWVFRSIDGMRDCYQDILFEYALAEYDIAARISQFIVFHEGVARWRQLRQHPRLMHVAAHAIRFRPKIESAIQHHPYLDGHLAQKAIFANCNRANFLHYMAGVSYGGDQLDIEIDRSVVARQGLIPGQYITVHNGFDPEFIISTSRATKCYPHFGAVIDQLREQWPELQFVQIGTSTSTPIAEVDLNLIGRTSLKEAAGIIEGAALHMDNEGGLVHLAACLGVRSCVVFGPTISAYFGYADNINVDPAVCGGCWWINETWMSQCPRGYASARCMTENDPRDVALAIGRHLSMTSPVRQKLAQGVL